MKKSMIRYGFILMTICAVASGLLSIVWSLTQPKILAQKAKEIRESLKEVLPDAVEFIPVNRKEELLYYRAIGADQKLIGVAFIATKKGYADTIETLVGLKADGQIAAIKILRQNETPGLGNRISEVRDRTTLWDVLRGKKSTQLVRPWFQEQFSGVNAADAGSIQAITGATISSKAVIDSVTRKALEVLQQIRDE